MIECEDREISDMFLSNETSLFNALSLKSKAIYYGLIAQLYHMPYRFTNMTRYNTKLDA